MCDRDRTEWECTGGATSSILSWLYILEQLEEVEEVEEKKEEEKEK
jgi:hypothetical protein